MDKKLSYLFEYHKFSPNKRLEKMVAEAEREFMPLSDDELAFVTAAGRADVLNEKKFAALREDPEAEPDEP